MVTASVNVVDVIATKAGVGQSSSAKQGDAKQSDGDFSQVLSSLNGDSGGDESGSNDKAATANAAAEVAPIVEKAADDKDATSTDADLAADLLALCGVPVAPNMTPPAPPTTPTASTVAATVTSMTSTATAKTSAAMLGLDASGAEAVKPIAESGLNIAGAKAITPSTVAGLNSIATNALATADAAATDGAVPTSIADAVASPATSALNEQVGNTVTPFDMQWLRSNARALNAQAGSASSALTPTANDVKDATVTDLSKALLNNQSTDGQSGDVAQSNSVQNMLGQAAPIMAMLSAQGRDERLELKDVAPGSAQNDASIALNTSQLQPAGTQLASDSNGIDTSARHQLHSAVGTHQWATELGNKLTLMASKDTQSATLYMTPADMGPVQVRIETNKDQASVWFTADHAETRSALEQSLPRLREMFTAQGMSLTDAGVFGDRSRQQQSQTQPQTSFTNAGYDGTVTAEDTARVRSICLSLLDAYA